MNRNDTATLIVSGTFVGWILLVLVAHFACSHFENKKHPGETYEARSARKEAERTRNSIIYSLTRGIEQHKAEFASGLIDAEERDDYIEYALKRLDKLDATYDG